MGWFEQLHFSFILLCKEHGVGNKLWQNFGAGCNMPQLSLILFYVKQQNLIKCEWYIKI